MINNIETYDENWKNSIFDEIFNKKEYEYENIIVEENDIVVDLGANIGIFSLYAESKKAKIIYAFEPIKEYATLYKKNLQKYSNFFLSESAISYKNEKSNILINFQNNTILQDVYESFNWTIENRKIEIDLISINDFMKNIEKVDFLKVDIEGTEYDVFENITPENLNKIKKIACEYHWNYNNRLDLTLNKLKENNFKVFNFEINNTNKTGKLFAIKN